MVFELQMPTEKKRAGRNPFWVAKILGVVDKDEFKREYLTEETKTMLYRIYLLEDGLYNYANESSQKFIVVKNGKASQIEKETVKEHIK